MIWHETVESSNSIENELNFRVQTAARSTSKVTSVRESTFITPRGGGMKMS